MSIRLDPRRLTLLKQLAAEQDMRPGELVTQWVSERVDAARTAGGGAVSAPPPSALAQLTARVDQLAQRLDALTRAEPATPPRAETSKPSDTATADTAEKLPQPKRRGRTAKSENDAKVEATDTDAPPAETNGGGERVALHDEIIAVLSERGPLTATDLAEAISRRGRYSAPRSGKPLDATTVSSRVSNPAYRSRFRRADGKIALADTE